MECVALPEVVGVGFCKCEPGFGAGVVGGFEQLVTVDDAPEGVGGDLGALEKTFLDTGAVNFGDVVFFPVEGGEDLLNGFEKVLGGDFAGASFVGPGWWIGDAVFAIVIPPGLDGAPGELAGVAVLVEEDGLTDGLVASEVGVALGVFECPEDSHFEVVADAFHMTLAKLHGGGCGVDCHIVLLQVRGSVGNWGTMANRQLLGRAWSGRGYEVVPGGGDFTRRGVSGSDSGRRRHHRGTQGTLR